MNRFTDSCLKIKDGKSNKVPDHILDKDKVAKVIHVFRNPLDNMISNYHLNRKIVASTNDAKWLDDHPNDSVGFQKWCRELDKEYAPKDQKVKNWFEKYEDVPCALIFYRFLAVSTY